MSSEMFEDYEMELTSMLNEITKSLNSKIPNYTGGMERIFSLFVFLVFGLREKRKGGKKWLKQKEREREKPRSITTPIIHVGVFIVV